MAKAGRYAKDIPNDIRPRPFGAQVGRVRFRISRYVIGLGQVRDDVRYDKRPAIISFRFRSHP